MEQEELKNAVNQRFIEALSFLVERKYFKSLRDYGIRFNIKPSSLTDFKSNRSHVDIRHIITLTKNFPFFNLYYIVLGEGKLTVQDEEEKKQDNIEHEQVERLLNDVLSKKIFALEARIEAIELMLRNYFLR